MDLHVDGTYVKEVTDWLLMTKIDEQMYKGVKQQCCILMMRNIAMIYIMIQQESGILFGDLQNVKK